MELCAGVLLAKAYGYICMRIHAGQGTYPQDAYGTQGRDTESGVDSAGRGLGHKGSSRADGEKIEKRGSDAGDRRAKSRG